MLECLSQLLFWAVFVGVTSVASGVTMAASIACRLVHGGSRGQAADGLPVADHVKPCAESDHVKLVTAMSPAHGVLVP